MKNWLLSLTMALVQIAVIIGITRLFNGEWPSQLTVVSLMAFLALWETQGMKLKK